VADTKQDKGFSIPPPDAPTPARDVSTPAAPAPAAPAGSTVSGTTDAGAPPAVPPIQPREYAIAGTVLILLLVAFFFAKNAYSNFLARNRVAFGPANAAGWWLYIFLMSLSTAAVLSVLSAERFLVPLFMIPFGVVALVALVLMLVSGRRG